MKKKILAIALIACLAVTAITGASLAYLQDTDSAKNVMTVGKVEIVQNEQQRDENGNLVDFVDDKIFLPAVGDKNGDGMLDVPYDDAENNLFSNDRNVVDKMISVTNTGNQDAYVRTILAFELPVAPEGFAGDMLNGKYVDVVNVRPYLTTVMNKSAAYELVYEEDGTYSIVEIDGVFYLVTVCYYMASNESSMLKPGETTEYSLKQIYLAATAGNEESALLVGEDGDYNILALSQAVQTAGFANAQEALDTAFGEVNAENAAKWLKDVE